jgi:hypothetical protein
VSGRVLAGAGRQPRRGDAIVYLTSSRIALDRKARVWSRDVDSHAYGTATEPYGAIDERQGVSSTVNGGLFFAVLHALCGQENDYVVDEDSPVRESELLHKVMEERVGRHCTASLASPVHTSSHPRGHSSHQVRAQALN